MINLTQLQTNLETEIQNLTGSESAADILSLTAAIDNLTTNRFVSVQNYADLPNLTTNPLPSGSLILVKQLNIMMMSVGTQWRGIDGRVYVPPVIAYGWGSGSDGRVGDNTITTRSSPVTVVGGITNWSLVEAGRYHSLGLRSTGIAYAWGSNNFGQLGDNTTVSKRSPVTVIGGITNWSQMSAGNRHSLGITSAGIAYAWGGNSYGRLGDNTITDRSSPVTVVGGVTNWSQISAGAYHSLGVASVGIAYAWGYNVGGRLGDNTTSSRSSPVTVAGGITNWSLVIAGGTHSLGLTSTGIAYAWGLNSVGQIGDGTSSNRSSPVTVVGSINWSLISPGSSNHCLGIGGGIAYAWGAAGSGKLGNNSTALNISSPVTVVGGITNWSLIAAGTNHSLGLTQMGILYSWGANSTGQLGVGASTSVSSPVSVIGGITGWTQISSGDEHNLALAT